MEKVFASVSSSSPLSVAVARTSQSPFPLCDTLKPTQIQAHLVFPTTKTQRQKPKELEFYQRSKNETKNLQN